MFFFWLIRLTQDGEHVSAVGICHIIACTLFRDNPITVHFDDTLLLHVHPYTWLNEGLPTPPDAAHKTYDDVCNFFKRRVRLLRLQPPVYAIIQRSLITCAA